MKINNEFTVSAPVEEAWDVILDLERVAPCLPGASIQESDGDEYKGTMKVKIGPITATYKGTVKFEETDEQNRRAVLNAKGSGGQGTASATITSTMEEQDGQTKVNVETDMKLSGRAAQFGRGGIAQDVASKMLTRFAECLEREISGGAETGAETAEEQSASAEANGSGAQQEQEATPAMPTGGAGSLGTIISSDPGTVSSTGGTVEGAVIAGGTAADAEASAPAAGTEQSGTQQEPPRRESRSRPEEPEAFDLGAAGQEAVLKRVAPVAAGAGLLALVIWLLLRRR